ncbi:uncharacterized protein Tco025E_10217, partial [Trypanosoma conorhini]
PGSESRLCAQARCDSCPLFGRLARALQITSNPHCRWRCPSTEDNDAPQPPLEPPPNVRTVPARRMMRGRPTPAGPVCCRVFVSVTNMKLHARRVHAGVPLPQKGLQCGYCGNGKLFLTSASRAGHYRKCQAYQLAKSARGTVAEGPEDPRPYGILTAQNPQADVTPDGPRETLSHLMWEIPVSVG